MDHESATAINFIIDNQLDSLGGMAQKAENMLPKIINK